MPDNDAAEFHADQAETLLNELRDGTTRHGPYAPSATSKAAAAQAHALLAIFHAGVVVTGLDLSRRLA